jgi:MFS family permease
MAGDLENRVMRKVAIRIVPFIMLLYFVAYIDRVNIGFAALAMNQDLGFSPAVFGLGAGIFFWGYFLFEIPSNIISDKVGARLWIARVMITWGIVSAGMAFAWDATSFYVLRFLLGAAEAGFFPASFCTSATGSRRIGVRRLPRCSWRQCQFRSCSARRSRVRSLRCTASAAARVGSGCSYWSPYPQSSLASSCCST